MRLPLLIVALAPFALHGQAKSPITSAVPTWTVASAPMVRIGGDASPQTLFNGVSAVRMRSGEIAAFDLASREVRIYSSTGSHVRTIARRGSGPGEIEGPAVISTVGDTLYVMENGRRLLHVFTATGFVRQHRASATNAPGVLLIAPLPRGAFLMATTKVSAGGFVAIDPSIRPGMRFGDSVTLGVISNPDSGTVQFIGAFEDKPMFVYPAPQVRTGMLITRLPIVAVLARAASGDLVWAGNSASPVITLFGTDGKRVREVTLPIRARPLDDAAVARVRDRLLASARADVEKQRAEAQFSEAALPPAAPFYRSLLPGPDGEMWVQLFDEDPDEPPRYLVYARTGAALGQVLLPRRFTATQAGADFVVGTQRDDDDVESVAVLRLTRGR